MEYLENTFENGMNVDFDPVLQPKGTYRYSLNGRITTSDGKNFVWTTISGNELLITLNSLLTIIGFVEGTDKLFIFSKNNNSNLDEIGYIEEIENEASEYVPIYVGDLEFTTDPENRIRGYYYDETQFVKRIYWTDGVTQPKCLNTVTVSPITNPSNSNIDTDKQYLITRGWIIITDPGGSAMYNRGDILDIWPPYISDYSSDFVCVEYVDIDLLPFNPDINGAILSYSGFQSGKVTPGIYYFAYRYKTEGYKSPFSALCGPITVDVKTKPTDITTFDMKVRSYNYQTGGFGSEENTVKINLNLTDLDSKYSQVEFLVFKLSNNGEVNEGYVFNVSDITAGSDINISFDGDTIEMISAEDYYIQPSIIMSVWDICTIKKMAVASGVEEESELNVGQYIECEIYPGIQEIPGDCITHVGLMDDPDITTFESPIGLPVINDDGTANEVLPGQWYEVTTGLVKYPAGTGTLYGPGSGNGNYFVGINPYFTISAGGKYRPVYRFSKYFDRLTNDRVYEYIPAGTAYGYKGTASKRLAGLWGEELYRYGILPISKKGTFLHVRWLKNTDPNSTVSDLLVPKRRTAYTEKKFKIFTKDTHQLTSVGGQMTTAYNGTTSLHLNDKARTIFNNRIVGAIIQNLDLTDIIDDIDGFCIVRSPRKENILMEGFAEFLLQNRRVPSPDDPEELKHDTTISRPSTPNTYKSVYHDLNDTFGLYFNSHSLTNHPYCFFITPDLEKLKEISSDIPNKRFVYERTHTPTTLMNINNVPAAYLTYHYKYYTVGWGAGVHLWKTVFDKFYNQTDEDIDDNFIEGVTSIDTFKTFDLKLKEGSLFTLDLQTYASKVSYDNVSRNLGWVVDDAYQDLDTWLTDLNYSWCGIGTILELSEVFNAYTTELDSTMAKIFSIRKANFDYGGESPEALGITEYVMTGHYQKVDNDFKNAIKYGDRYIVENIEVYGGDCYLTMWPYVHTLKHLLGPGVVIGSNREGYYMSIPIQSTINPLLMTGVKLGRQYMIGYLPEGTTQENNPFDPNFTDYLRYPNNWSLIDPRTNKLITSDIIESYTGQGCFSKDIGNIKHLGLPVNFLNEYKILSRIRYGVNKTAGEEVDSFRKYLVANKIDLNSTYGNVIRVIPKKDYLFVWQNKLLSLVPVNERALQSNELGLPIQLGIGTKFERNDDITKHFGLSHYYGLIEVQNGLIWYDSFRKAYIYMSNNEGIKDEGIAKGWDSFFTPLGKINDIMTCYDPLNEFVFTTITENNSNVTTLIYDLKVQKLVGFTSFKPYVAHHFGEFLISSEGNNKIYIHTKDANNFFDVSFQSILKIIIGSPGQSKRFMTMVMHGSEAFADEITYSYKYNYVTNQYEQIVIDDSNDILQHYRYVPDEWRWGVPDDGEDGRIESLFFEIEFVINNPTRAHKIIDIITLYNKLY